jgi:hypothetical protein
MDFNLSRMISRSMFSIRLQRYQINILIGLIGYDLVSTTVSIDLTMAASTTKTSLFWLW